MPMIVWYTSCIHVVFIDHILVKKFMDLSTLNFFDRSISFRLRNLLVISSFFPIRQTKILQCQFSLRLAYFILSSGVTEELDLPAEPLHAIFQSLIEALLKTSGSYQRVRANLYGSLLYYLQIGQRKGERRDSHGKTRKF